MGAAQSLEHFGIGEQRAGISEAQQVFVEAVRLIVPCRLQWGLQLCEPFPIRRTDFEKGPALGYL
ncbi:hypothetical protein Q427_28020 [Halomonas sp. BC04]|nr:hypothetical protein [Halomonas sp. BC04]EWG98889.1 hypothetical protein Q427_28020 [Halomonas sp. BC04]